MAVLGAHPQAPGRLVAAVHLGAGQHLVDVAALGPQGGPQPHGQQLQHIVQLVGIKAGQHPVRFLLPRHALRPLGLESGQHQGQHPVLALPAFQPHQAAFGLHVQRGRGQQLEQRRQAGAGKGRLTHRPAHRMVPGGVAEFVAARRVGAFGQQRLHQRGVAGRRGQHQRRGPHRRGVVGAVHIGRTQDVLEVLGLVGLQMALLHGGQRSAHQLLLGQPRPLDATA